MIKFNPIYQMKLDDYFMRKAHVADDKDIPDLTDRRPRPDERRKIKFTLASAVGLAGTMMKALRP